eukprot:Nk52_evm64s2118 gene=Nk52_evmTU64s2118
MIRYHQRQLDADPAKQPLIDVRKFKNTISVTAVEFEKEIRDWSVDDHHHNNSNNKNNSNNQNINQSQQQQQSQKKTAALNDKLTQYKIRAAENVDRATARVQSTTRSLQQNIFKKCTTRKLRTCPYDLEEYKNTGFKSIAYLAKAKQKKYTKEHMRRKNSLRMKLHQLEKDLGMKERGEEEGERQEDHHEVVLTATFYHSSKMTVYRSINILGSQSLMDLKKAFSCSSDNAFGVDSVERQAGCFFIENVFYTSDESYCENIIKWVQQKDRYTQPGLGMFSSAPIESKKIEDLNIRLNHPYLFSHHGDCEHIVCFHGLRMLNPKCDPVEEFPLMVYKPVSAKRYCDVCSFYRADFVTIHDKLASSNPAFYCSKCYQAAHYGTDGKLLFSDYEEYPYVDDG